LKPDIILCSVSGFGQYGPYRERPAFDPLGQAMSGLMSLTGMPVGQPLGTASSIVDGHVVITRFSRSSPRRPMRTRGSALSEGTGELGKLVGPVEPVAGDQSDLAVLVRHNLSGWIGLDQVESPIAMASLQL
jgi:hypothetical protein